MTPDIITLSCPNCGGKLQIPSAIEQFACGYCGNELKVQRGGGIISLTPVVERLDRIDTGIQAVRTHVAALQPGIDTTASELAIQRLDKQLAGLYAQLELVKPKGVSWATAIAIFGVLGVFGLFGAAAKPLALL